MAMVELDGCLAELWALLAESKAEYRSSCDRLCYAEQLCYTIEARQDSHRSELPEVYSADELLSGSCMIYRGSSHVPKTPVWWAQTSEQHVLLPCLIILT